MKKIYLFVLWICLTTPCVNSWMWSWSWPWSSNNDTKVMNEDTVHSRPQVPHISHNYNCTKRRSMDDQPFYIGRTNLFCMLYYRRRRKRNAPSVYTMILTHRWLRYKGVYFEFGTNALDPEAKNRISIQQYKPSEGDHCSYDKEPPIAGYSRLSVNCIAACTFRYPKVFGEYSLLTNNCHVFVNKIAGVLCENYDKCPDWCTAPVFWKR